MNLTIDQITSIVTWAGSIGSALALAKYMSQRALDEVAAVRLWAAAEIEEAKRVADAAHKRLDEYNREFSKLGNSITRLETLMEVMPQTTAAALFKEMLAAGVYRPSNQGDDK